MDVLAAAMNDGTLPPDKVRFFLGYAGWVVAQLAWEVEVGSWWVAAASSSLIRECMQGQSPPLTCPSMALLTSLHAKRMRCYERLACKWRTFLGKIVGLWFHECVMDDSAAAASSGNACKVSRWLQHAAGKML